MSVPVNAEVAAALAALPLARLAHFTPALNLPSVLADGQLRSVKDLTEDVRACYRATDLQRLDGHPDKVCCSLQYPNGFYFDIAQRKRDVVNYPDWICLLVDKKVAAAEGTLFCPRNAAAGYAVPGTTGLLACYAPSVLGQGGQTRARGPQHDRSPVVADLEASHRLRTGTASRPEPLQMGPCCGVRNPASEDSAGSAPRRCARPSCARTGWWRRRCAPRPSPCSAGGEAPAIPGGFSGGGRVLRLFRDIVAGLGKSTGVVRFSTGNLLSDAEGAQGRHEHERS